MGKRQAVSACRRPVDCGFDYSVEMVPPSIRCSDPEIEAARGDARKRINHDIAPPAMEHSLRDVSHALRRRQIGTDTGDAIHRSN